MEWIWIVAGVWVWFNLGWRLAEYKIKLFTTYSVYRYSRQWYLYYLLWPATFRFAANPFMHWGENYNHFRFYKYRATIFLPISILWNLSVIIILLLLFILTWGRFDPIYPNW